MRCVRSAGAAEPAAFGSMRSAGGAEPAAFGSMRSAGGAEHLLQRAKRDPLPRAHIDEASCAAEPAAFGSTTRRLAFTWLALAVAASLAAGCGGKKRPPAVATGPASTAPAGRGQPTEVPQPVETGPDVRAVDAEAARGEEFTVSNPDTGEGGPLEDIHFEYDSANLTDQARSILEKHALWLQNHREAKVLVEGHCDERGTVEYNLALGEKRARAARDYLASLGVSADRLRTVSYGKERPMAAASSEAAWAMNRRVHFAVSR